MTRPVARVGSKLRTHRGVTYGRIDWAEGQRTISSRQRSAVVAELVAGGRRHRRVQGACACALGLWATGRAGRRRAACIRPWSLHRIVHSPVLIVGEGGAADRRAGCKQRAGVTGRGRGGGAGNREDPPPGKVDSRSRGGIRGHAMLIILLREAFHSAYIAIAKANAVCHPGEPAAGGRA